LNKHEVTFEPSDNLYNIITKTIIPSNDANQLLAHDLEGQRLYNQYKLENLQGKKSPWDRLTKRKLPSFQSANKVVKVKVKNKEIILKEQALLMTRMMISARKRPEVDLEALLGRHEFSVVPRSMFESDGSLLLDSKKSILMDQIEEKIPPMIDDAEGLEKVYIYDGMAVLNKIQLGSGIKNCHQLAQQFLKLVCKEDANEIRVVFDNYFETSLKATTRIKRLSSTISTKFEVKNDTNLEKLTMKKFLSHIETKQKVTAYLGNYLSKQFEYMEIPYAVSFQNTTISNIPESNKEELNNHNHEEADTLMILHAIDVASCNPFRKVIVCSLDTDVFLLLIHHYE